MTDFSAEPVSIGTPPPVGPLPPAAIEDVAALVGERPGGPGQSKPRFGWITRIRYDPDAGARAEDFVTSAHDYAQRFAIRLGAEPGNEAHAVSVPGLGKPFVPVEVEGTFLEPVEESGRWRPVRIGSKRELQAFNESARGRAKRLAEAGEFGDFGDFDRSYDSLSSPTRLIDREFVPITAGPFYKQLYIYDYLCLSGSTPIPLLDGTSPTIAELAQTRPSGGFWVYSCTQEGRVVAGKATAARRTGEGAPVVRVVVSGKRSRDGASAEVVCTATHPFLTRDGRYVRAGDLKPGDRLMPLYRTRNGLGYERLYHPGDDRWEYTHRAVFGDGAEVVHHLSGNRRDNRPENLSGMSRGDHLREHVDDVLRWDDATVKERRLAWQRDPDRRSEANRKISATKRRRARCGLNHVVVAVEPAGREDVFDLTVEGYHNFAVGQGVFVHNSMHARAFQLQNHNALATGAVKLMSRFALGRGITFHIKHDEARRAWEAFWKRNKMRTRLRTMARDLVWQGELMLSYREQERGGLRVREIDPSTCWEVVTDPEDVDRVYYYHFQYPCLRGDVRVACLDGTNPTIAELAERGVSKTRPAWVYSYNEESGRVVPGRAVKCWRVGRKRCVEVELDNGEKIVASHDHPFLLRDGRYVWAEKLQPSDSLMPLYRRSGYEELWQPDGRWELTHHVVAAEAFGRQRRRGEVVHHLNLNRRDNEPMNLAYVAKVVHDAETSARRWEDPALERQRADWVKTMRRAQKQNWADGVYAHLTGKGSRKKYRRWRRGIAAGVAASWRDPQVRAARVAGMRASKELQVNHSVVAVRPAGSNIVYDLQVERFHNFALAAGVFTHNTPYQIWVSGHIPSSKYIVQQVPPTNIQHVKINCSATEKRGRSMLLAAIPWLKRIDDFYSGATVKAMLEANLVWKVKIRGDLADIEAAQSDPALTELPPPGGIWFENESVDLQAISAQMTAGRGSSGIGGQLAAVAATSMNLPAEYFNIESPSSARATALVRTDPAVKAIEEFQQILRETVEEMYLREMQAQLAAGRISARAAREEPDAGGDEDLERDDDAEDRAARRMLAEIAR